MARKITVNGADVETAADRFANDDCATLCLLSGTILMMSHVPLLGEVFPDKPGHFRHGISKH